jgi:hypothetical protein
VFNGLEGRDNRGQLIKELFLELVGYCMTLAAFSNTLGTPDRGWTEGEPLPERPRRPPLLRRHFDK